MATAPHRPPLAAAATVAVATGCNSAGSIHCTAAPVGMQQATAEEQLAEKYAPIVYLREQPDACEPEAFQPMPVDVVLGNPRVRLVRPGPEGREVKTAPTAADLYRAREEKGAYLDLPGRPGNPDCTYARDFGAVRQTTPAVTYAYIVREKGLLALQYWFYYYFNDWNNQHESDWEMIQLLFDADTVSQALEQEPLRVSYAQHSGGETRNWNSPDLTREGNHPVVHASAGSHASYFDPKVYLGLGERGSGVGCDHATGPARRVPLEARLVPTTITGEDDPFAWSVFQGRWGEHHPGQNNGPTGPNTKPRWRQPVTHFDEDIRDYSATLPRGTTLGPNAVDLLCGVVGLSGRTLGLYYESPLAVGLTGGALALVGAVFLGATTRRTFFVELAGASTSAGARVTATGAPVGRASAITLYRRHLGTFLGIGVVFIPIGVLAALLNHLLEFTTGGLVITLSLALPLLAAFVFVNGTVAAVLGEIEAGRRPGILDAYRMVWRHLGPLVWAAIKVLAIVTLLLITVVGIPFAINRLIRWLFIAQAIVLDGADSRTALSASAHVVAGRWWRTCFMAIVLGIVGTLTGPVVAIIALVLLRTSADAANLISSAVYALVLPLVFIALTQFYQGLKLRRAIEQTEQATYPSGR
ncbi:MAG: hypothetical protein ACRDJE_14330 [Dehalococcoidia bacterium]